MTKTTRYLLVAGVSIVGILLFLLASASENSAFFDQNYPWLLGINVAVTITLLGVVILLLTRLYKRYRRGKFGSKLMTRLVLLFALVGIIPGILIYVVSVQFVSRSIESWFDVRVESALESGLKLGRAALDKELAELNTKTRAIALNLAPYSDTQQNAQLLKLHKQGRIQEALILTADNQIIASTEGAVLNAPPNLPNANMLQQAHVSRSYSAVEGETDAPERSIKNKNAPPSLQLRVLVRIPLSSSPLFPKKEERFLQLLQAVPAELALQAETLRTAYGEYQIRSLARSGLRKIYIVTLTLTLLLAIFAAIVSAILIATNLAKPLLLLAEGTKAIAEGNLSPRPIVATKDELGTLTQSFNDMTKQLLEARNLVEKNRIALENAKAYLESVLANMSAGVMVLDDNFNLLTCNTSAERILHMKIDLYLNQSLMVIEALTPFASAIVKGFSEHSAQSSHGDHPLNSQRWQQQITLPRHSPSPDAPPENEITLLARGSYLPIARGVGYLIVFDDISDVIAVQRSIAWGEVAQRLAHEIKNPLTPIQLSAERLLMKLTGKLSPEDAEILAKSTKTIVNQVASMKQMVNDFKEYARTPSAALTPLDLNNLIEDILHLYSSQDGRDIIHAQLDPALPLILGDATQLRQVIHNLIQNAQDAVHERSADAPVARIDILTEPISYNSINNTSHTAVRFIIKDNGPGFSPKILARAFEPYVTSKPRGTGLGLPMVKKIIEEHGGKIDLQNRSDVNGAKISILLLQLNPQ